MRRAKHLLCLVYVLWLVSGTSNATAQTVVPPNVPLTAAWNHSGEGDPLAFPVYVNGAKIGDVPGSALVGGEAQATISPLSPGTYVLGVAASNAGGESARAEITLIAEPQTQPPNEVFVGQSFQVAADHNGQRTTEYRLYRNGALVQTLPVAALSGGTVTFGARSESAVGSVLYEATAFGAGGESQRTGVTVTVVAAPVLPPDALSVPRIIKIP